VGEDLVVGLENSLSERLVVGGARKQFSLSERLAVGGAWKFWMLMFSVSIRGDGKGGETINVCGEDWILILKSSFGIIYLL
jgi:hypothetical protein